MIFDKMLYLSEYHNTKRILYFLLADFKNHKTFTGVGKIKTSKSDLKEVEKIIKSNSLIIQIPINEKTFLSMLELNYIKDVHNEKTVDFLKRYNLEEWSL